MHDAVSVNIESDLDLRDAAWGGRNSLQLKLAQQFVVGGHLALPLQHLDAHLRLVVGRRAEHLRLLGRDRRVPAYQTKMFVIGCLRSCNGTETAVHKPYLRNLLRWMIDYHDL
jgi:hypothetical protein